MTRSIEGIIDQAVNFRVRLYENGLNAGVYEGAPQRHNPCVAPVAGQTVVAQNVEIVNQLPDELLK